MKRSKKVRLPSMCRHGGELRLASVTVAAGSLFLAGCSEPEPQMFYYTSLDDCKNSNPQEVELCEAAYEKALREAQSNGPRFNSMASCEGSYGPGVCYQNPHNNWFMPALVGFMVGRIMDGGGYHYSQPRYPNVWQAGAGYGSYSSSGTGRQSTSRASRDYEKRAAPTRSRGGFGSQSQAKSSWGRSSSRSWGG